jgi:hypothetical protein
LAGICEQGEKVMLAILWIVLTYPLSFCRPRNDLAQEVLALRHQLMVLQRSARRPKLHRSDRYLWLLLMKVWPDPTGGLVERGLGDTLQSVIESIYDRAIEEHNGGFIPLS